MAAEQLGTPNPDCPLCQGLGSWVEGEPCRCRQPIEVQPAKFAGRRESVEWEQNQAVAASAERPVKTGAVPETGQIQPRQTERPVLTAPSLSNERPAISGVEDKPATTLCSEVIGQFSCELPQGHSGRHRNGSGPRTEWGTVDEFFVESPVAQPAPESAEQFLASEINKTGMARTDRPGWEAIFQFAEAYAASRLTAQKAGKTKALEEMAGKYLKLNARLQTAEQSLASAREEIEAIKDAARTLLEWCPTCSEGSSGYLRIERLRGMVKE